VPAIGLQQLIELVSEVLGVHRFFTVGKTESRSWLIPIGCTAVEAAAKIHTDISEGFIKADVMKCEDFLELGSEKKVRESGRMAVVGR